VADTKLNGSKLPISFQLGDKLIDGAVVKPLMFVALADCVTTAQTMTQPLSFEARLKRLRMIRQVTYYSGASPIVVSSEDILKLPIPAARVIVARLDDQTGIAGKVIRDGNGIDQAIVYELGTPIPVQGKEPIRELEFQASTYGDIEDVMAADISLQQTSLLISTIAKPLGFNLSRLPTWALSQITVADGVTISRDVLPRFLESPVD
jgi:hypothetical protein